MIMDTRFEIHNLHHIQPEQYQALDSHLRLLQQQPYLYENPLINQLPRAIPGIYTIGGGRQVGKTTLLKQWIAFLIKKGITPQHITFFTGELINDFHQLISILIKQCTSISNDQLQYIIIDEITYVKEWDRGIKFIADAGYLHNTILILTGSDLTLMQSARMTFPGRRGKADKVDYHLHSLSFKEFLSLKKSIENLDDIYQGKIMPNQITFNTLYNEFNEYLKHGGYLTAINDIARDGYIGQATLQTYSDWIRGDILKRGKQENYLKEIIHAIITRYNKQITWHNLADAISIDSAKTVADYCELLVSMDALFIQSALIEDKLVAAPKKARKLTFTDPFIYHALKHWLKPTTSPHEKINHDVMNPIISSNLVEATVSNHYARFFPTYYIKANGEIDVAYIYDEKFWPVEIKWRNQLHPKDLKQLTKYKRCKILSKTQQIQSIENIPIIPLPLELLMIGHDILSTL